MQEQEPKLIVFLFQVYTPVQIDGWTNIMTSDPMLLVFLWLYQSHQLSYSFDNDSSSLAQLLLLFLIKEEFLSDILFE